MSFVFDQPRNPLENGRCPTCHHEVTPAMPWNRHLAMVRRRFLGFGQKAIWRMCGSCRDTWWSDLPASDSEGA